MKPRMVDTYPNLELVAIKPSDEDQKMAFKVTQDLMKAYPDIKGFFGISSVSFPGAAEAVKQAGQSGKVMVTGLATPNSMKPMSRMDGQVGGSLEYRRTGHHRSAGAALAQGALKAGETTFEAGKLGTKQIEGDHVPLGDILVFTDTTSTTL